MSEAQKAAALFAATVLVGASVVMLGPRVLALAGGPESELLSQLKSVENKGFEVACDAGVLLSRKVSYQRLSVEVQGEGGVVWGTLDFTGTLGATEVSSVGLERVHFARKRFGWQPRGSWAPRLAALVEALEHRRALLETGKAQLTDDESLIRPLVPPFRYQVRSWFIRHEREETLVAEDYRLTGQTANRPVDSFGTRRLTWHEGDDGQFRLKVDQAKNPVILDQ